MGLRGGRVWGFVAERGGGGGRKVWMGGLWVVMEGGGFVKGKGVGDWCW